MKGSATVGPKKAQPLPPIFQPEAIARQIVRAAREDHRLIESSEIGRSEVMIKPGEPLLIIDHPAAQTAAGTTTCTWPEMRSPPESQGIKSMGRTFSARRTGRRHPRLSLLPALSLAKNESVLALAFKAAPPSLAASAIPGLPGRCPRFLAACSAASFGKGAPQVSKVRCVVDQTGTMHAIRRTPNDSGVVRHASRVSIPHSRREPGSLFPGGSAVRGIQVTGTSRQGDGVPKPSRDIRPR